MQCGFKILSTMFSTGPPVSGTPSRVTAGERGWYSSIPGASLPLSSATIARSLSTLLRPLNTNSAKCVVMWGVRSCFGALMSASPPMTMSVKWW